MGYHVYDLMEFDMSAIGEHGTYVFFFSQNKEAFLDFAEKIGRNAASITNGIQDVDWLFLLERPKWLHPHTIWYATILVACPNKPVAQEFLELFRQYYKWKDSPFEDGPPHKRGVILPSDFYKICVISIPPNDINAHNVAINFLAGLIKTGAVKKAIELARLDDLREHIEKSTGIKTYLNKNTIIIDTANTMLRNYYSPGEPTLVDVTRLLETQFNNLSAALEKVDLAIKSRDEAIINRLGDELSQFRKLNEDEYVQANKARRIIAHSLLREMNSLRKQLSSIPAGQELNSVFMDLAKIQGEIRKSLNQNKPISLQASIGFETFGNGIKLMFDSSQISDETVDNIKIMIRKLLLIDKISKRNDAAPRLTPFEEEDSE